MTGVVFDFGSMRDQYAGDLSDLLKFALIRTLAFTDKTIGVAWYYNPKRDRLQDGRHREYCEEPKWASLDPDVWNALRVLSERTVIALEQLAIWPPKTLFHRTPVPVGSRREEWAREMVASLECASLILLDPDNGIGNATRQHATLMEIASARGKGRPVLLIKFPSRNGKHQQQIKRYHHSLLAHAGALSAVTLCMSVSVTVLNKNGIRQAVPRVRWFTLIDADAQLIERAEQFANKLSRIEKCKVEVVQERGPMTESHEKPAAVVLRLMGVLERALRAITPDQSAPFHKQVETHSAKFSDAAGISDARRTRNAVAHGETVSDARAEEAQEALRRALLEISPHCPDRMRTAIREALAFLSVEKSHTGAGERIVVHSIPQTTATTTRIANICPECGHQFKGHGFDGIDAHWRARHEAVMPYKHAWPLIKSGNYHRASR